LVYLDRLAYCGTSFGGSADRGSRSDKHSDRTIAGLRRYV